MPDFDNIDLAIFAMTVICIIALFKGLDNVVENCVLVIASLATGREIGKRKK